MVLSKDSVAAKGLLRNSSVRTTERHYIKVPENRAEAVKQLEALQNLKVVPEVGRPLPAGGLVNTRASSRDRSAIHAC
jgi:hypothetical protein